MSCCMGRGTGSLQVFLEFKREELLYDIANYAYIEGHILAGDAGMEARHMVQDACDSGNVDRILRVLDVETARCKDIMYPYTKEEMSGGRYSDKIHEADGYVIKLELPDSFSQTTVLLIEKLVHEYLVCKAVSDWMSITNTQKAEVWLQKADEAEAEMRRSLNYRRTKVRIRPHFL